MSNERTPLGGPERLSAQHPSVIAVGLLRPRAEPPVADHDAEPAEPAAAAPAPARQAAPAVRWSLGGWLLRYLFREA